MLMVMETPMRRDVNLRGINLNLLPVLNEIVRQRNLTRAAESLNMTQSAVSNALKLLREHFQDEILVRDGRQMRLTELGQSLLDPLDEAMGAMQRTFAPDPFDPARSEQRFRLSTADYVMAITAPHLARILSKEAPLVAVQMLNARRQSEEDLRVGRIDMVITPKQMLTGARAQQAEFMKDTSVTPFFTDRLVCIGHKNDPDLAKGISAKRYLERAHAGFFLDFDIHASLEQFHLGQTGTKQFDRLLISSFSTLPAIVANSDCLALLPESMAKTAVKKLPIRYVEAPIRMPPLELVIVSHRRRDRDPGLRWLIGNLKRCADLISATQ
jgi:LysR family transcriptional regulator, nod-box dependent transcriptional activator